MQNAKLKLLLDFLPYILGPWLFRVQDVELKKFSGDRAISPKRSSPELPAPLISSGIYLHLQGDVMPFEKENSINNQRSPITIDVLAKRLVRKTANGKGNVFDFFFVHLIYKTYKDHLKAGKVPKFLKFLRKPTLLTESEEDKILWEASDAIDEAARYPKSEVPDEKIDNVNLR